MSNPREFFLAASQQRRLRRQQLLLQHEPAPEELFETALTGLRLTRPFLTPIRQQSDGLAKVFDFFSLLNTRPSGTDMDAIVHHLSAMLSFRKDVLRGTTTSRPIPSTSALEALRYTAGYQRLMFHDIGGPRSLMVPAAIEAFASGSLTLSESDQRTAANQFGRPQTDFDFHGPDGAIFFLWCEFALLASADVRANPDSHADEPAWSADDWQLLAAVLLRAQHIFLRSYATLEVRGLPIPTWGYANYRKDEYTCVDPSAVSGIEFTARTLAALDDQATNCVAVAMPGDIARPPQHMDISVSDNLFCP